MNEHGILLPVSGKSWRRTPGLKSVMSGRKKHRKVQRKETLGARTLLGAPGLTTRSKKLLEAPGIATRSKKLLGTNSKHLTGVPAAHARKSSKRARRPR